MILARPSEDREPETGVCSKSLWNVEKGADEAVCRQEQTRRHREGWL